MSETIVSALVYGLFPGLLVYGAATDAVSRRIPNWVSAALLLGFLVLAVASGMGWATFGMSMGVGFIAFAFGFAMFAFGQMGGGDAKVIAATMPWFGWTTAGVEYAIMFSLAGVVISLPFILRRIARVEMLLASNPVSARLIGKSKHNREVPYGLAIAAGGLFMVPSLASLHGLS